jgi:hypothetical protein
MQKRVFNCALLFAYYYHQAYLQSQPDAKGISAKLCIQNNAMMSVIAKTAKKSFKISKNLL